MEYKRTNRFNCENCKREWIDNNKLSIQECPYCGSSGLKIEEIRIKVEVKPVKNKKKKKKR